MVSHRHSIAAIIKWNIPLDINGCSSSSLIRIYNASVWSVKKKWKFRIKAPCCAKFRNGMSNSPALEHLQPVPFLLLQLEIWVKPLKIYSTPYSNVYGISNWISLKSRETQILRANFFPSQTLQQCHRESFYSNWSLDLGLPDGMLYTNWSI